MKKGIIIFLLILIGIGALSFFMIQQSVVGVGKISISGAEFDKANDRYLINVIVDRTGEHIVGKITPKDLQEAGLNENIPTENFEISFDLTDVSCNNKLIADNIGDGEQDFIIYKLYQTTVPACNLNGGCPYSYVDLNDVKTHAEYGLSVCKGHTAVDYNWRKTVPCIALGTEDPTPGAPPNTIDDYSSMVNVQKVAPGYTPEQQASEWCHVEPRHYRTSTCNEDHFEVTHIGGIPFYRGYKIDSIDNLKYKVKITLNKNNEQQSAIITDKTKVADIGSVGRVKWVGNLITDSFCGNPESEFAVVKQVQKGHDDFKIVDRSVYENYKDNLRELINFDNNYYANQKTDPGVGADVLWSYMSSLNTNLKYMYDYTKTHNCEFDKEGEIIKCKPENDIVYPELQLIIDADWLGVDIPKGNFKIVEAKNGECVEGNVCALKTKVSNIDLTNRGVVDLTLLCNKGDLSLGYKRVSLEPKSSKEIEMKYNGNTGVYNCSIVAQNVNIANNRDSKNVTITIKERKLPGGIIPKFSDEREYRILKNMLWGLIIALILTIGYIAYMIYKKQKKRKK